MANQQLSIFISYGRPDSEFVDRLDADLRARGYRTWVDRRRLEGGVDWEREINAAIADCDLFLISLSQAAVASSYVQQEFEEGQRLGKPLMPVLYQNCTIPTWFAPAQRIQQQDFTDTSAYTLNLKRLLYAIQDPTLNLSASTTDLYSRALALRASDPERAAITLQHIIDREPNYSFGQPQRDLASLDTQLYASRVTRLRTQAEQARQQGQYGVEAASLEALIALGDRDASAYAWAQKYLPVAVNNRAGLDLYNVIQERVAANDLDTARSLLSNLWQQAPYFRDPANIAPALGINLPPTYAHDQAVAAERKRFEDASATLRGDLSKSSQQSVRASLRRLNYDLDDGAMPQLIGEIVESRHLSAELIAERNGPEPVVDRLNDSVETFFWILIITILAAILVTFPHPISQFLHQDLVVFATIGFGPVFSDLVITPLTQVGFLVQVLGILSLGLVIYVQYLNSDFRANRRKWRLEGHSRQASIKADGAYRQWRARAEQVLQQRIAAIDRAETPT